MDECDRSAHARGWCKRHYERWRTKGSTDDPPRRIPRYSGTPDVAAIAASEGVVDPVCSADGCNSHELEARGLCGTHYAYWYGQYRRAERPSLPRATSFRERYVAGPDLECWLWQGAVDPRGYGKYDTKRAHRLVYEERVGPIPDGMVLDHICRNRLCVNPNHLDPVRQGENVNRGLASYAMRDRCKKGLHDITQPEAWFINPHGKRTCRACLKAAWDRGNAKKAAKRKAAA
ncbi:HNH endonuclease signature motif containing protein [Gordonia bronchialis]|uniref:HNH endonuclease signature motif containing protein n=1 Tax=Gordonia bronchialis TaxID=2054 RepID=UPI001CBB1825